jgi:hypothetical protein
VLHCVRGRGGAGRDATRTTMISKEPGAMLVVESSAAVAGRGRRTGRSMTTAMRAAGRLRVRRFLPWEGHRNEPVPGGPAGRAGHRAVDSRAPRSTPMGSGPLLPARGRLDSGRRALVPQGTRSVTQRAAGRRQRKGTSITRHLVSRAGAHGRSGKSHFRKDVSCGPQRGAS